MEIFEGKVEANGIPIYARYLPAGDKNPVVLIMGLSFQLTTWPPPLIELFQNNGYPVLLFDNRDIGLSHKMQGSVHSNLIWGFLQYKLGLQVSAPYTLYDMADDVIGLLDHFKIPKAHIWGMSMGGMIAQIVSAKYSDRVKTLTLISTSDNSITNHPPDLEIMWRILGSGISGDDLQSVKKRNLLLIKSIISRKLVRKSDKELLKIIEANYNRNYSPEGRLRQMFAILASPNLQKLHPDISVPVKIIHGEADPFIHRQNGLNLHRSIKGSKLYLMPDLAHDLPEILMPRFFEIFSENQI